MPAGWDSYSATVAADGPVAWYRFDELLAGQPVTAGSQDPQNFCFDSSANGNLNLNATSVSPYPNGNYLQYGSAVIANSPPSPVSTTGLNGDGGSVLFPSTGTTSLNNIITGGPGSIDPILQPTAAISVSAWHSPNVITTGSVKQVLVAYGSDASSLSAYNLYHIGSTAINHTFAFSINIGGALKTATAALPALVVGGKYYVVGTYDGVNVRIYVNGVLQGTTAATGAISYASLAGLGLAMGNDASNTDANLQGYMDDVAIYNKALTAARITYQYRQGSVYLPFVWNH
jgi:hypothetical protein